MDRWIRPTVAVEPLIEYATGETTANQVTYVVARAKVPTMDYRAARAVKGTVRKKRTKGPFQIGPMAIGRVHSEGGAFIDADWYFKIY